MAWVVLGLAAGAAGSAGLTHLLRECYTRSSLDPLVLGSVSLLLAAVALIASYLPARRAAKIDPIAALRATSWWRAHSCVPRRHLCRRLLPVSPRPYACLVSLHTMRTDLHYSDRRCGTRR